MAHFSSKLPLLLTPPSLLSDLSVIRPPYHTDFPTTITANCDFCYSDVASSPLFDNLALTSTLTEPFSLLSRLDSLPNPPILPILNCNCLYSFLLIVTHLLAQSSTPLEASSQLSKPERTGGQIWKAGEYRTGVELRAGKVRSVYALQLA